MTRLVLTATILTVVAAPAFACDMKKSVTADTQSSAVASQPSDDHATAPQSTATDRKS
jgi:hypothetical protein